VQSPKSGLLQSESTSAIPGKAQTADILNVLHNLDAPLEKGY